MNERYENDDALRALFNREKELPAARREAIKSAVMRERAAPSARSRPTVWAAAAALAILALGAAWWASRAENDEISHARIAAGPDARLEVLSAGAVERVRMEAGRARFFVDPLEADERFLVEVGESVVEVVGTAFVVEAERNRLTRVEVLEGIVRVTHDGDAFFLHRGERFPAPAKPEPVIVPSPPAPKAKTMRVSKQQAPKRVARPPAPPPAERLADVWRAISHQQWPVALEAFDALGPLSAHGSLEPTLRYWRIRALIGDNQRAAAREELTHLRERFPRSREVTAAEQLLGAH